jgi:hypothetical protein
MEAYKYQLPVGARVIQIPLVLVRHWYLYSYMVSSLENHGFCVANILSSLEGEDNHAILSKECIPGTYEVLGSIRKLDILDKV